MTEMAADDRIALNSVVRGSAIPALKSNIGFAHSNGRTDVSARDRTSYEYR